MEKSLVNHFYSYLVLPKSRARKRQRKDWAWKFSYTGISRESLRNIRHCADLVFRDQVPGDFLEAGVWRGVASIYMMAILKMYRANKRRVYVVDSFQGMSPANLPQDATLS